MQRPMGLGKTETKACLRAVMLTMAVGLTLAFHDRAEARIITALEATGDTYATEGQYTPVHGGRRKILADHRRTAYFRFDVSQLPAGALIHEAKLRLLVGSEAPRMSWARVSAYAVLGDWHEDMVSDANAPGCQTQPEKVVSIGRDEAREYVEWDISVLKQLWVNEPDSNFGVALRGARRTVAFASKESADPPPQLFIAYGDARGVPGRPRPRGPVGPSGADGADGADGLSCWDLNANNSCDLGSEDRDASGACDTADCAGPVGPVGLPGPEGPEGPPGPAGADGAHGLDCWDLNSNGTCDLGTEDADSSGTCDAADCEGPQGPCQSTKCMTIESPSDSDNFLFFRTDVGLTVTGIDCLVNTSTSAVITVQECNANGGSCAATEAAMTCGTTNSTESGAVDDSTIDAGDWLRVDVGAVTGAPGHATVCVTFTF